jgi:shikimate kinase
LKEVVREAMPERIVLVGFMGSGKTTVGQALARRLGWQFVDLDDLIEAREQKSIRAIFRDQGEAFFREREREAARSLHALPHDVIVAAGGGAFTIPETRAALSQGAVTIWLRCGIDAVMARTSVDGNRPLATDRDGMTRLLDERRPHYELAKFAIDTDDDPVETVAQKIDSLVAPQIRASVGSMA